MDSRVLIAPNCRNRVSAATGHAVDSLLRTGYRRSQRTCWKLLAKQKVEYCLRVRQTGRDLRQKELELGTWVTGTGCVCGDRRFPCLELEDGEGVGVGFAQQSKHLRLAFFRGRNDSSVYPDCGSGTGVRHHSKDGLWSRY